MVNIQEKKVFKTRGRVCKKIVFSFIVICILIMISIFMVEEIEHPKVILGGQTMYMDYVEEGAVFIEDYYSTDYEKVIEGDLIPVQIGEVSILNSKALNNAINRYRNEFLEIKVLDNGKIYRRDEYISNIRSRVKDIKSKTNLTGKISMYIPQISTALSFAHPISTNDIRGTVYKANVTGLNENGSSICAVKVNDVIGYILGNDVFGTTIRYIKEKIETEDAMYISIAKKSEVKLGKAFLYTDFGEGLNYYEIEIISFTVPDYDIENRESYAFRGRNLKENVFEKDRFYYIVTDERLINKSINNSIPGMSGSPVIQEGRLIGFSGYYTEDYSIAIYAESAYWDTILKYIKEDYK